MLLLDDERPSELDRRLSTSSGSSIRGTITFSFSDSVISVTELLAKKLLLWMLLDEKSNRLNFLWELSPDPSDFAIEAS